MSAARVGNNPAFVSGSGRSIESLAEDEVLERLSTSGAILFRGFDTDADRFRTFAERFTFSFLTSPFGDRKNVDGPLQTVTVGQSGLDLHFEFGNSPLRPDLLWFHCETPPGAGRGGATTLADGVSIYGELSEPTRDLLGSRNVKYSNYLPKAAFDYFLANEGFRAILGEEPSEAVDRLDHVTVTHEPDDMVRFDVVVPFVRETASGKTAMFQNIFASAYAKPSDSSAKVAFSMDMTWEDGERISEELVGELTSAANRCLKGIRWNAGDFLLIDNNRFMHGRKATNDPDRSIFLLSSFSHGAVSEFALDA